MNISALPQLRGCVVKDDAIIGPFHNALLIYVFKPGVDNMKSNYQKYGLDSLLLPPLVVNVSPWENGIFIPSGENPLRDIVLPSRHIFQNCLNGKTFDEYSEPIDSVGENIGDFALKFDTAIIPMIMQAYEKYQKKDILELLHTPFYKKSMQNIIKGTNLNISSDMYDEEIDYTLSLLTAAHIELYDLEKSIVERSKDLEIFCRVYMEYQSYLDLGQEYNADEAGDIEASSNEVYSGHSQTFLIQYAILFILLSTRTDDVIDYLKKIREPKAKEQSILLQKLFTETFENNVLKFEFEPIAKCDMYEGFELGHLSINGSLENASSSELHGRGAMMIFTSAVGLLDGVRNFLQDPHRQSYEWVGDDSSFVLQVKKYSKASVKLMAGNVQLGQYSIRVFSLAVRDGVSRLMQDHGQALNRTSAAFEDLSVALTEFDDFLLSIKPL